MDEQKKEEKQYFTLEEVQQIRKETEEFARKIGAVPEASVIIITRLPLEGNVDIGFSVVGLLSENVYLMDFVKFQMLFREQVKVLGQQQAQRSSLVAAPHGFDPKKGGHA